MQFTVIDKLTGQKADEEQIALSEDWAKSLTYCDVDGFAITEDGSLIFLDSGGNWASCPVDRFTVQRPEFNVTEGIRQSMTWPLQEQLVRLLVHEFLDGVSLPCGDTDCRGRACERLSLSECAKGLNLSPEMRTAISILADLDGGRITCLRDTQTSGY